MTQWGLYGITTIEAPALAIQYAHGDSRAKTPDGQVEIAVAREKLRRPLQVLNDHLATQGYLVGGRFTVADINMAEMVRYAQAEKKLLAEFPAVRACCVHLGSYPAAMKSLRHSFSVKRSQAEPTALQRSS